MNTSFMRYDPPHILSANRLSESMQVGFGDAPGVPIPWSANMKIGPGTVVEDSLDGYQYRINRDDTHFFVERCSFGFPGALLMSAMTGRHGL